MGLAHADSVENPDDADFDHYRIVIEDGSGDLLGYQAQTVNAERTYDNKNTVFGVVAVVAAENILLNGSNLTSLGNPDDEATAGTRDGNIYKGFTNIRLSNQVTDGPAMSPYYASIINLADAAGVIEGDNAFAIPDSPGAVNIIGLSYGNVLEIEDIAAGSLYVEPPQEYFDFPSDVFEDDGAYVIKAWAEDDDGTRISPVASIKLSVREGDSVANSTYLGYQVEADATDGSRNLFRSWDEATTTDNLRLAVYGLSIEDE